MKVRKKPLINPNYFNLESFSDNKLFDTNRESFIINIIIKEGILLMIYTLENNLKNRNENNKELGIYINNLINRVYANLLIIINIREAIKSGTR